jgi:hypothetical protein
MNATTKIDFFKKFTKDLKKGEGGEEIIANYFIKIGYKVEENFKKNSDYDLKLLKNNKSILIEVKTDEYYLKKRTNNMVFEVSCNGKPSGLNSTKADYYIYYFPEENLAYMASISTIKSIIPQCITTYGGDGGRAKLYLVDRDIWKDYFKIFEVKDDNFNI